MTPLIQKIVKLANITFSNGAGKESPNYHRDHVTFVSNLTKLKCLLSNLRAGDVTTTTIDDLDGQSTSKSPSFLRRLLPSRHHHQDRDRRAPVAYTEILENNAFTIGMFLLRGAGIRIPLHDHPGMHGIIKVIHGVVTVDSYSAIAPTTASAVYGSAAIAVKRSPSVLLDANSEPCCLSPDVGNYHEIKAVDGPAAFVDILSPPYDYDGSPPTRECRFYRCEEPHFNLRGTSTTPSGLSESVADVILTECSQPIDFWCENIPYTGPKIYDTFDAIVE